MLPLLRTAVLLSLAPISAAQVTLAKEPLSESRESSRPARSGAKVDDPLPATTPYDADAKERGRYLHGYRDGRAWALHPDRHDHATTNPNSWNGAVIRGFVEGWQAGVRAAPEGTPTGDLPAKYARFLQWNQAAADAFVAEQTPPSPKPDWNQIRTARIKAHDRGSATEFTGQWTLTLPQGSTYTVELSRGDDPLGLLQITSDNDLVLLGGYSLKGDRLQLVAPKNGVSAQDFDWQYRDGRFVLESYAVNNGGQYLGAILERLP